jgi:predicted nucleotidyltransferase
MDRKIQKVIKEITKILIERYHPEKIVLFGSYAYGTPDEESDIDLFIVSKTSLSFYKRLLKIRRLTSSVRKGYSFEPIVLTPRELKARLSKKDQFFEEIMNKGKVLYAK